MSELPLPAVIGWLVHEHCGGYDAVTKVHGHMRHIPAENAEAAATYRSLLQNLPEERVRQMLRSRLLKLIPEAAAAVLDQESLLFFNRPAALPVYGYWARMTIWSVAEATALALNRDPRVVNWTAFEKEGVAETPFATLYLNLGNLIHRAVVAGVLDNPLEPSLFLSWCQQQELAVPRELVAEAERFAGARINWQKAYSRLFTMFQEAQTDNRIWDEAYERAVADHGATLERMAELQAFTANVLEELNAERMERATEAEAQKAELAAAAGDLKTRERDSLLKLLIAATVDGYGYNPTAARSPIPSQLVAATERLGISLSDETIRKWLKLAAEHLPPEAEFSAA